MDEIEVFSYLGTCLFSQLELEFLYTLLYIDTDLCTSSKVVSLI